MLSTCALPALCAPLPSPITPTTLRGRVTERGLPSYGVPDAAVRVQGAPHSSKADQSGHFQLNAPPHAPLTLCATAPEYLESCVTLSALDLSRPLRLELTWAGVEATPVEVTTTRREVETASTTRLNARELNAAPRRNAEELLRQVPGLTLVQHGSEGKGHQYFMRGFDATHGADLELTVDGVPLNEWSNIHAQGYLDLGLMIPELIQKVVVQKGPFTLDQGAFGVAGSADYHLGVPNDALGWRAAYTAGTTNRHRAFVGYAPTRSSGHDLVGVELTRDEGFGDRRALHRATLNSRARLFNSRSLGALSFTALGSYSAFELPGTLRNSDVQAGVVDFYGAYDPRAEGSSARALLTLHYKRRAAAHRLSILTYGMYRRLALLENFTGFLLNPKEGDWRDQRQEAWSFGLTGRHELKLTKRVRLHSGLGLRGDELSQRELRVGSTLEPLEARRALDGLQMIGHALTGLRWSPLSRIRVDAGARLDLVYVAMSDQLTGGAEGGGVLLVPSPRLTARWRPHNNWSVFLAYGRGLRPPEARAFSSFDPDRLGLGEALGASTQPSVTRSDSIELSARWEPSELLKASLSGFGTFIQRESIFDHISGVNLELTGTRRLGAELLLSSQPLSWLTLSGDLTYVDARFTGSGRQVPLAPWLVSGLHATVSHPNGLTAGLRALTVAPRPLPHGATGETLVMSDATLGYRWELLSLHLELENLLNRRLREGEYHYASHWRPGEPASELPALHMSAGAPLNARLTLGLQW